MAMSAALTISGLTAYDPTIWTNLILPAPPSVPADIGLDPGQLRAAWTIDKDALINYICMVTSSMSLVYPDADYMKTAIQTWSMVNYNSWQRVFDTLFYKYNPIFNKDGTYREDGEGSSVNSGHDTTENYTMGDGSNKHYTHGYNAGDATIDGLTWTHADLNQNTASGSATSTTTLGTTNRTTDARIRTERGNIGVTTTQQMIKEERDLAMTNIYEIIADSFKRFFCVQLY